MNLLEFAERIVEDADGEINISCLEFNLPDHDDEFVRRNVKEIISLVKKIAREKGVEITISNR